MRGLAEYVMSGRRQAATVAVLFGLIPMLNLLSAAVVALVALRKGSKEGALIMMWALLPAGLHWLEGETASVIMLVGVLVLAQLLRRTQSWQQVLLLATVLGLLLQLSLPLQQEYLESIRGRLVAVLESGGGLQPTAEGLTVAEAADQIMALWVDVYGVSHAAVFIACLMLGRYLQALLYNPGGFRQEFHGLRIDRRVMGVLLLLVIGGLAGIEPLASWIMLFCIVPSLVGLAVVHRVVAMRKMNSAWLFLAYLLALATPLILALGFADSWIDVRKRMAPQV